MLESPVCDSIFETTWVLRDKHGCVPLEPVTKSAKYMPQHPEKVHSMLVRTGTRERLKRHV